MKKVIAITIILSMLFIVVFADVLVDAINSTKPSTWNAYILYYIGSSVYAVTTPENVQLVYNETLTEGISVKASSGLVKNYYYDNGAWVNYNNGTSTMIPYDKDYYGNVTISDGETVFFSPSNVSPFLKAVRQMNLIQILTHPLTGLIAFLIGLWIMYLVFSKAWQFLSMQLRKG